MHAKRFALPAAAFALVLLALPASAHVTVHGLDAVPGGDDAEIVFRVPNEEATPTTKVEIALPADKPIAGVYAESKPGWSFTVRSAKLATPIKIDDGDIASAVVDVTWTATAGGIPVGGYEDFSLAVGHLPDTGSITFKALQTYKNGDVVRWIESGAGSEHPAPVLTLGASQPEASPSVTATASPAPVATKATSDDSSAKALGGAGLAVAVVAAVLALGAFVRSGRSRKG
ncbi:MAG: YcnI family protein [Mycobacteriales bacterium]